MKFELDDKTVLKIGAAAAAGFGLSGWVAPEQHQNLFFEASTPKSNVATQWFGMGVTSVAACNLTVAMSDEPAPKTVKNLLKTSGAFWGIAAAQTLYNAENGWQKKDMAYVAAAGQAVIGALSLWRGYCEEED